ncbi:CipC-like antibiotic stress responsive protein [Aspergillus indologenus CBS 114.80]|uniref:CipC-like antibiotic stress responsive protein n=1 Tax=Aspergillus indologenus CBS 114.80 TaxID=1450541 RepID=A0A2V5J5M9_9EURO|nr:CipC-like antibiotic stress responsive protein [Aspergillus indologenus CBS 114.80]
MRLFSDDHEHAVANVEVYGTEGNSSHWSPELIGGAAAFEAAKLYEEKTAGNGKPDNLDVAKEIIAGIASAEVDKLFTVKGLDFINREKAKSFAKTEAAAALTEDNY